MTPTMLRCVLEAVAGGHLPAEELCEAVNAVARGQAVATVLRRLYSETPPELEAGAGAAIPGGADDITDAIDPDELAHLFEALRVCRTERGPCLLLSAAFAPDWGVDPELLVGLDAEDEVDGLLAVGGVAEAVELAQAGAERLELE